MSHFLDEEAHSDLARREKEFYSHGMTVSFLEYTVSKILPQDQTIQVGSLNHSALIRFGFWRRVIRGLQLPVEKVFEWYDDGTAKFPKRIKPQLLGQSFPVGGLTWKGRQCIAIALLIQGDSPWSSTEVITEKNLSEIMHLILYSAEDFDLKN